MNKKILSIFIVILLLVCSLNFSTYAVNKLKIKESFESLEKARENEIGLEHNRLFLPGKFKVKGIYVSGWIAGVSEKINNLIRMVDNTELNSMVIDIKDQLGYISYNTDIELARNISANKNKIKDIRSLITRIHSRGIYIIGRIAVFKDPLLAQNRPDLALTLISSQSVKYKSTNWVYPGNQEVWEYNIDLAREAIRLGFDEIQFDYIRFPALAGQHYQAVLESGENKSMLINNFLSEARTSLDQLKAPLSIDVFGLTTSVNDDLGIGQNFFELSNYVSIISPMVYPSHYSQGNYGIPVPATEPYRVIFRSIGDAMKKIAGKNNVSVRPWLQDFTLKHQYTAKEVKAQIEALNDLGIKEWLLWNPSSHYTEEALLPQRTGDNVLIIINR